MPLPSPTPPHQNPLPETLRNLQCRVPLTTVTLWSTPTVAVLTNICFKDPCRHRVHLGFQAHSTSLSERTSPHMQHCNHLVQPLRLAKTLSFTSAPAAVNKCLCPEEGSTSTADVPAPIHIPGPPPEQSHRSLDTTAKGFAKARK